MSSKTRLRLKRKPPSTILADLDLRKSNSRFIMLVSLMALCVIFSTQSTHPSSFFIYAKTVNSPTLSDTAVGIGIGTPNPGNINDDRVTEANNEQNTHSGNTAYENRRQELSTSSTRHNKKQQKQQQQRREQETTIHKPKENNAQHDYHSYMHWCEAVLGIQSVVEVKEFEYIDHLRMHWDSNDRADLDAESFDWLQPILQSDSSEVKNDNQEDVPIITIRGLAAKHDIAVGDVVISIPLYSLLSVPTTIDHDPVLSRILGPNARQQYGWTNTLEYEVPLLVVAILYHRSLEQDSPLWRYINVLSGSSTEYFPFLWNDAELRSRTGEIGVDVRELARGIRQDVYEMYDSIMGTLVKAHFEVFGPPEGYSDNSDDGTEWHFSYRNFQWAFAMVISRHHFLPISEFDEDVVIKKAGSTKVEKHDSSSVMHETLTSVSDQPPANQPTDSWVEEAINEERVSEDTNEPNFPVDDDLVSTMGPIKHSFMAPLADLINFGPPCLTGLYNSDEHAFELIATCPFKTGQEVTFWYSSDCSDIIVANYGFVHPLVPSCTNMDEWKDRAEALEEKARIREDEMWDLYKEMDLLKEEINVMHSQLIECGCEEGVKKIPDQKRRKDGHSSRHEIGVRGHSYATDDHDVEDL